MTKENYFLSELSTVEGGAVDTKNGLSALVQCFLSHYFEKHQDHLPFGKLHGLIIAEVEKPLLLMALQLCKGNQKKTSELLGINRNTLRKKLLDYQIDPFG